jgi:hypothetical protein
MVCYLNLVPAGRSMLASVPTGILLWMWDRDDAWFARMLEVMM